MPVYGYSCSCCEHTFDKLQKLSDPDPTQCPNCKQEGISRQLSAPQIRLVGTGWYETDFKSKTETRRNLATPTSASPPKPSV